MHPARPDDRTSGKPLRPQPERRPRAPTAQTQRASCERPRTRPPASGEAARVPPHHQLTSATRQRGGGEQEIATSAKSPAALVPLSSGLPRGGRQGAEAAGGRPRVPERVPERWLCAVSRLAHGHHGSQHRRRRRGRRGPELRSGAFLRQRDVHARRHAGLVASLLLRPFGLLHLGAGLRPWKQRELRRNGLGCCGQRRQHG